MRRKSEVLREKIKLAHPDRGGDSEEAKSLSVAWNAIRRRFARRGIRL
jgi:cation transport regulator ChaB